MPGTSTEDGATGRRVNDGNDPVVGASYCITGRGSGFKCGWVVRAKGVRFCFSEQGELHVCFASPEEYRDVVAPADG